MQVPLDVPLFFLSFYNSSEAQIKPKFYQNLLKRPNLSVGKKKSTATLSKLLCLLNIILITKWQEDKHPSEGSAKSSIRLVLMDIVLK